MFFSLDFRNILILISLAIHTLLLFVLFRGRKTPGGLAFSVTVVSIAAWVFSMVLYRAEVFGQVLIWVRLLYVMASLIPTSFFYFSLVFPENRKISMRMELVLLFENLVIIAISFSNSFITGVTPVQDGEGIIHWGPLYFIYALHIMGLFSASFVVLYRKMKKAVGVVRNQILNVLIGSIVASALAGATNLILPWFGYFSLNWIGQFFSTLFAAFSSYSILKHNLLYIRVYTTEGFILILNLVLFIQVLFSDTPLKVATNGAVFVAVMMISVLLIKSVYKEIKRREELAQMAQSLEQANVQLKELDKQKTDFLSIAAHQLRTPLSIANGYLELLADGAYGKITKEAKTILHNMDESNGHLVKLVDSFLDITRLEQGRTKYDFAEHDLNKLTDGVVNELIDRAAQKNLHIVWRPQPDIPSALFDEEKVRHVIFNYIDNAIKYSDSGPIVVTLVQEKNGLAVRVKDSGLGFDKVDESNFFQKFYRGNNVQGINVNGTGLGLFVCAKFIEAHHGRVWAHSEGLGKGSEFGFWIPLHA